MSNKHIILPAIILVGTGALYAVTDGPTAIGFFAIIGVPLYLGVTNIQRKLARLRAEREGAARYNEEVRRRATGY